PHRLVRRRLCAHAQRVALRLELGTGLVIRPGSAGVGGELEVVHPGAYVPGAARVPARVQEDLRHAGPHRGAADAAVLLVETHGLDRAAIVDGPGHDEVAGEVGLGAARVVVASARQG